MNKVIEIYRKNVWGNILTYVKDPEQANAISLLTNSKTLSGNHIGGLEMLGFKFKEVLAPHQ